MPGLGLLSGLGMGATNRLRGLLPEDMPMGGGMGQGAFPPPPPANGYGSQPSGGGISGAGGGLSDIIAGLFGGTAGEPNYGLAALGQGISSGDISGAYKDYAPAIALGRSKNKTKQWLMSRGMSPEDAEVYASNPSLLAEALQGKKRNLVSVAGGGLYDADSGQWIREPNGAAGSDKPSSVQEFEYSQTHPGFADFKNPKADGKAPNIQEFYDENGAPYKAQYNPQTQTWDKIGSTRVSGATETQRNNLSKARQAVESLDGSLNNYQSLAEASGASILPGQEKDNLNQARTDIMLQLKELYNLGVLNGPDYQLMQGMIFDPTVNVDPSSPLSSLGDVASKALGGNIADRTKNSIMKLKQIVQRSLAAAEATNPAARGNMTVPPPGDNGGWTVKKVSP